MKTLTLTKTTVLLLLISGVIGCSKDESPVENTVTPAAPSTSDQPVPTEQPSTPEQPTVSEPSNNPEPPINPEPPPAPPPEPPGPVEPPRVPAPIEGNWQSTCVKSRTFGLAEAIVMSVEQTRIQHVLTTSREIDCSLRDIEITQVSDYKSLGTPDERPGVELLELSKPVIKVKPLSAIGVSSLRILQWCGIKDWALGVERDVTANIKPNSKNCARPIETQQAWILKDTRLYTGTPKMTLKSITKQTQYFVR